MSTDTFAPSADTGSGKQLEGLPENSTVVVVGAGAFGGWTALNLLRANYNVTLLDSWGPGHSRSSSGDETRVIRSTYGANEFYFNLNVRSLQLWKEHEHRWKKKFFHNKGVLWLCYEESTPIVDESLRFARKHRMEYEKLSVTELGQRYPILNTADLSHAYFDPYGGCLRARDACQAVQNSFLENGGKYLQAHAMPGKIEGGRLARLELSNGQTLKADVFIFACGSWLGKLFPEVLGTTITCTKQEVYLLKGLANMILSLFGLMLMVTIFIMAYRAINLGVLNLVLIDGVFHSTQHLEIELLIMKYWNVHENL